MPRERSDRTGAGSSSPDSTATSRTRVLFVHHRRELGGAPTSLAQLIGALDLTRFEPHVYCPAGESAMLFEQAGAVVHTGPVAGFTHIWASSYRGLRWLLLARELSRLPAHLRQFGLTLRRTRFDLVHLNDSPLVPAAWLASRAGIPVVWHLRAAPPHGGRDLRSRLLARAISRLARATIAINADVAELWGLEAEVIPNSVDLDRFSPGDPRAARELLGLPASGACVSSIGFLYPAKGFRQLIEAAAILRERGLELTTVIVGGGVRPRSFFASPQGRLARRLGIVSDGEAEAAALVAELGLESAVRLVPFTPDAVEVYRASDVVVAPSQGPELARPLLEAAATGVAALGTGSRAGGGILAAGITTVFARDSGAAAIAGALEDLLTDPERRAAMGTAARVHAQATFDPERNARRVEALYERALERTAPPDATASRAV